MKRRASLSRLAVSACLLALTLPHGALAQEPDLPDPLGNSVAPHDDLTPSKALRWSNVGAVTRSAPPATFAPDFLPDFSGPTLTWIAIAIILMLTLQTRRLRSWHTVDGLMLALIAVLLPLRDNVGVIPGDATGQTVQGWAYLLLFLFGLYWVARGLKLLLSKAVPAFEPNVSEGAMVVLIAFGLFLAFPRIITDPVSPSSRDGLAGGICLAETGRLPYGDAPGYDTRSPLLYLVHGGAVKLIYPTYEPRVEPVVMRWEDRAAWLNDAAWETVDVTPIRLVNGLLFILLFAALAGLGHRFHSVAVGQTLVAILCVFPGALECFTRPDIMLPTTLLAWSIVFVRVPRIGGLLSVFVLILAGLAWPWAWLALPVTLFYFFRKGWQALGAVLGLLGGAALGLVGITAFVAPTLPRDDGALAQAGITPEYSARLSDDGTPVIEYYRPDEPAVPTFKSPLWEFLLGRDDLRLDSASIKPALPNGTDAHAIRYRDVVATGQTRKALQRDYRAALGDQPATTRAWAALRTLLEATWKPAVHPAVPRPGTWSLWAAENPDAQHRWNMIRRGGKIAVGLLAVLVALVMLQRGRGKLHQLIGGLLVVSAATLLISLLGPATNWVWLMPAALAALAVRSEAETAVASPASVSAVPLAELGPAPRITVEN
jgi:hypothetical protein